MSPSLGIDFRPHWYNGVLFQMCGQAFHEKMEFFYPELPQTVDSRLNRIAEIGELVHCRLVSKSTKRLSRHRVAVAPLGGVEALSAGPLPGQLPLPKSIKRKLPNAKDIIALGAPSYGLFQKLLTTTPLRIARFRSSATLEQQCWIISNQEQSWLSWLARGFRSESSPVRSSVT